jgi:hypothetical protein
LQKLALNMVTSPAGCGNRRVTDIEVAVKRTSASLHICPLKNIHPGKATGTPPSSRGIFRHGTRHCNGKMAKFPWQLANKQVMWAEIFHSL